MGDDTGNTGTAKLTSAQQKTLALLRRPQDPVVFEPEFVEELTATMALAVEQFAERLDDATTLWVSKHFVARVLGCEELHLADDDFSWNPRVAGGQVAHKAIELLVHWKGEPTPADLVDEAIAKLSYGAKGIGEWIAALPEADIAELRSFGVDKVIKFLEFFPPIPKSARPTTESTVRWPASGAIVLAGKADLTIGYNEGAESRKLIIDLKTGNSQAQHRDDLRFYSLVETLRSGTPPRQVASFYLDAGDAHPENIDAAILRSAMHRTLDAINRHIELTVEGQSPVRKPGPPCNWCPLSSTCDDGQEYLAQANGY